jgi:hypothetical protein
MPKRQEAPDGSPATRPGPVVGIAWYEPGQWLLLKAVAADKAKLSISHAEWLRGAERTERELAGRGVIVRRVAIDVNALVAWCQAEGRPVDAEARSEYTSKMVRGLLCP